MFGTGISSFSTPVSSTQPTFSTTTGIPIFTNTIPTTNSIPQNFNPNFSNLGGINPNSFNFSGTMPGSQPNFQNPVPTNTQSSAAPIVSQTNNSNRNPAIKWPVPKFYGEYDKAVEWYRDFREVSSYYQWNDQEMVKQARMNMMGSAKNWYNVTFIPTQRIDLLPYTTDPTPTWAEFSEEFLKQYRPDGSEIGLRKKLQSISKFSAESYTQFAHRVICLINDIDPLMTENEKIHHIREGLRRDPIFVQIKTIKKLDKLKRYLNDSDQSDANTKPVYRNFQKSNTGVDQNSQKEDVPYKPNQKVKDIDTDCLNCLKKGT